MAAIQLEEISTYLDEYLRVREVPDHPFALNGVQVANSGSVSRIAVAVDAVQTTIARAAEWGADLLLVHHGLFWDGHQSVAGRRYRRLRALFDADMAVYSAHIPLDVHPEIGNNAVLARMIGIDVQGTFGDYRGYPLGVWGALDMRRESLGARLDELLGNRVRMIACGPERLQRVGVITGGAGKMVAAARAAGLDAFVTGEGDHHHYFDAEEGEINLYFGGHYATEMWGVRALAQHLEDRFGLPWTFIDHPTGL